MLSDAADQRVNGGVAGTGHLKFRIDEDFNDAGSPRFLREESFRFGVYAVVATCGVKSGEP